MADQPFSDDAVRKATGRVWAEWRAALDPWAPDLPHAEIARRLQDDYGLSAWWAQTVTGGWGMMSGDEALLRAAVTEPSVFAGWAPPGGMEITTANPGKPVNARWLGPEGGRVVFYFTAAGEKTKLAINHERLPDADTCSRMKTAWRAAIDDLRTRLES